MINNFLRLALFVADPGDVCELFIGTEVRTEASLAGINDFGLSAAVVTTLLMPKKYAIDFPSTMAVQHRCDASARGVACLSGDFRIFISLKRARQTPCRAIHGNRPPGATTTLLKDHAHRRHRYRPTALRARFSVPDTHPNGHETEPQCIGATRKPQSINAAVSIRLETGQDPGITRQHKPCPRATVSRRCSGMHVLPSDLRHDNFISSQ